MAHRLQIRFSVHRYDTQGLGVNASGSDLNSLFRQGVMLLTLRCFFQPVLCLCWWCAFVA